MRRDQLAFMLGLLCSISGCSDSSSDETSSENLVSKKSEEEQDSEPLTQDLGAIDLDKDTVYVARIEVSTYDKRYLYHDRNSNNKPRIVQNNASAGWYVVPLRSSSGNSICTNNTTKQCIGIGKVISATKGTVLTAEVVFKSSVSINIDKNKNGYYISNSLFNKTYYLCLNSNKNDVVFQIEKNDDKCLWTFEKQSAF
ncbi:MAG: hypothetical protein AAF310_04190 [Myxococcota bacterium]